MSDPLYLNTNFSHSLTLPVFGYPVTYRSNSASVLALVERSFGDWQSLGVDQGVQRTFSIDVVEHDGAEGPRDPEFTYRMPTRDRFFIHTSGSQATVEIDNCRAYSYVSRQLIQRAEHCRRGMLEAMTLMLVTSYDRCPVHAAAVRSDGVVVMFAGVSGTGKSTLAYTLQANGYDVVTDDTVYVQMSPKPRIWYAGEQLTLLPDVAKRFSALDGITAVNLPTGKTKVVVPLKANGRPGFSDAPPVVCVLRKGEQVSLESKQGSEIHALLSQDVEPGFDLLAEQREAVLDWLCHGDGWSLTLSPDPTEAIPLIERILPR